MATGTYSFRNTLCTIVGPGLIVDLGMGAATAEEGITVEMTEDQGSLTVGAGGEPMHNLFAGSSGLVTVRLLKTSDRNALLSAAFNAQRLVPGLWGKNTITISNPSSGEKVVALFAAFVRMPTLTYAKEGGMNEWAFRAGQIDALLGVF